MQQEWRITPHKSNQQQQRGDGRRVGLLVLEKIFAIKATKLFLELLQETVHLLSLIHI